jgi:hypothetical protein
MSDEDGGKPQRGSRTSSSKPTSGAVSRRDFLKIGGIAATAPLVSEKLVFAAGEKVRVLGPGKVPVSLTVNGKIPNDGDHLGVSDYPDFLLVVPLADDPDPGTRLKLDDLMNLSLRATGTRHPGVLSLTQPSGKTFPALTTNALGHVVLQMKARIGTGETPIALVVKGQAQQ